MYTEHDCSHGSGSWTRSDDLTKTGAFVIHISKALKPSINSHMPLDVTLQMLELNKPECNKCRRFTQIRAIQVEDGDKSTS